MKKLLFIFGCVISSTFGGPVLKTHTNEERIIGGTTAEVGEHPYQVSIKSKLYFHICGGSIISNFWILTAAHCVYGKAPGSLEVTVGSNSINSGGFNAEVRSITYHEGYNYGNTENDIAGLHLARGVTFNHVVQPIKLADSTTPGGSSCWLSGWGLASYPSEIIPDKMQHILVKTITVEECQRILPHHSINDSNLCTHEARGRGVCKGDFGGPLVCDGIQHGIASWSISCAEGVPDVYLSVGFYRKWIKQNTGI